MNAKIAIRVLYILWLITAVMLVFAVVEKQSDSFYTLVRVWIAAYGSWRIGSQLRRWLLPPLSFGKIQEPDH
ncbi:MAG: hypothetical protein DME91_04225 [Verrucomicrobia bacterium]|nr:MAG: hypothetical protein DME91_04225 [Verrucomicrobiota bacterium]